MRTNGDYDDDDDDYNDDDGGGGGGGRWIICDDQKLLYHLRMAAKRVSVLQRVMRCYAV